MSPGPLPDPRLRRDPRGEVFALGRVAGHALRCRGEPYLAVDCYEDRCATNVRGTTHQENGPTFDSTAGIGHGVCTCGALSPHLPAGRRRRWWHRRHKARVLLGLPEPAGQPRPVKPIEVA